MALVLKRKAPALCPLIVPRTCALGIGADVGDRAGARAGSPAAVLAALRRSLTARQRATFDAAIGEALSTARRAASDDGLVAVPLCEVDVPARTVRWWCLRVFGLAPHARAYPM